MPSAHSSGLYGLASKAASPTTSGMDEEVLAITGQAQAMASRGGMPKPSYREGKAKTRAREYSSQS